MTRTIRLPVFLVIAAGLLWSRPVASQVDSTQVTVDSTWRATILRLFEETDVAGQFLKGMEVGFEAEKAANPEVPDIFWEEFFAKAEERLPEFLDMLVPVYADHFTRDQVEELITFYRTPLGRRLAAAEGDIAMRSMALGEQWGVILAGEVMVDLAKRGILPK